MALAIFGISNDGLNLAATLFILMIVVVWLALIVYTYFDAKRRISDPFLVACATIGSFFPYIGTAVYAIVRPPEFLEDAHERELEIRAAELQGAPADRGLLSQLRIPGREELPALPEMPAPAQGPLPELRQAGRSALGDVSLLRKRAGRTAATGQAKGRGAARATRGAPGPREERPPPNVAAARAEDAPARDDQETSRPARKEAPPRAAADEASNPKRTQRSPAREPDADPRKA